ncbi:hypothetical protein ABEF92_004752 [Exophiala dermatitidis]|uniref:tRNA-splicing endonuclease subunit Sen54 N-terminal domain-containing protein n=1 Tax=Exophiala dermatitidis (strain ATCC 34100 / CBS 525.76 / NIH/UT8656) TaxID=858893 RepID=H6BKH9_EXODN|nr:uncharacterized protein HMPREF1120_00824 [Exophiala dermatitidis NIH/UT8656]EHY52613.1 hypothetical protein HMPREF1120_00824 [Exophiala dermatitidis NIH/UT8656]
MADADEDAIPRTMPSGAEDLEDETQDFRFLAQLTSASSSTSGQAIIPKRGTKDFEPNPTRSQASALDAARLAMHTALSAVRVHSGRSHLVGQYLADPKDWRWEETVSGGRHGRCVVVPKFKSTHLKVMGQADRNNWVWLLPEEALFLLERGSLDIRWPDIPEDEEAEGTDKEETSGTTAAQDQPQASQDEAEGEADNRKSDVVTAPEDQAIEHGDQRETETNTDESTSQQQPAQVNSRKISDGASEPRIGQLPMSLQGAYASFIGKDGLTLERYSVYAGLKRAGYIVQRAPTWHDTDVDEVNGNGSIDGPQHTQPHSNGQSPTTSQPLSFLASPASLIHRLVSWLFRPRQGASCPSLGPLVAPGLYRNYADIFRALALIPYHDSSSVNNRYTTSNPSQPQPQPRPRPPFRVHFHVWKPNVSHSYRKTAPPPPDYRIAVIDARTTSLPTLTQIGDLLDSQPEDVLSKEKDGAGARLEARIKHGRRNVLLAVVDMGVTSYLRLSDACFGAEKLFEEKTSGAGSKGKGKGNGRGRGGGGAGRGGKRLPGQTRGGG